eukprot:1985346-Karenia_brevis.AAC.1
MSLLSGLRLVTTLQACTSTGLQAVHSDLKRVLPPSKVLVPELLTSSAILHKTINHIPLGMPIKVMGVVGDSHSHVAQHCPQAHEAIWSSRPLLA